MNDSAQNLRPSAAICGHAVLCYLCCLLSAFSARTGQPHRCSTGANRGNPDRILPARLSDIRPLQDADPWSRFRRTTGQQLWMNRDLARIVLPGQRRARCRPPNFRYSVRRGTAGAARSAPASELERSRRFWCNRRHEHTTKSNRAAAAGTDRGGGSGEGLCGRQAGSGAALRPAGRPHRGGGRNSRLLGRAVHGAGSRGDLRDLPPGRERTLCHARCGPVRARALLRSHRGSGRE